MVIYDTRKISSKRFYLQCVLRLGDLFSCGAVRFGSTEPQVFYKLLLRSPATAQSGGSAKDLQKKLTALTGDEGAIVALEDRLAARPPPPIADEASEARFSVVARAVVNRVRGLDLLKPSLNLERVRRQM